MRKKIFLSGFCIPAVLIMASSFAFAQEISAVRGKVSDADGRALEGAHVFIYDSAQVRRQASYLSAGTEKDGAFRIVLKPGKYWAIARLKKNEGYGPLMTGDKHSGEPVEIELAAGQELIRDFTVADLKDARKIKSKDREGPVKISGRILDEKGQPVAKAYAVAQKNQKTEGVPDYLSAWVDADGRYTLYLPRGSYSLGSATTFPSKEIDFVPGLIIVDSDRTGLDIVKRSR